MDNFSWLPLIFIIIAALSSVNKKLTKPGTRPFNPPPSPWARGFEPRGLDLSKWTSGKTLRAPWAEPETAWEGVGDLQEIEETTEQTEGTTGTEGTQGLEGTAGVEGTYGIEGTFRNEGTPSTPTINQGEFPSRTEGVLSLATLPTDEELMRAMIWSEILGKPKSLRARK